MKLSLQLANSSLFAVVLRAHSRARRLREKMTHRLLDGREYAAWEVPYSDPEAIKHFAIQLRDAFPKEIMAETLLFVNHGVNGAFQAFFLAGFPENIFPHIQPALNQIVGVTRTFNLSPEFLIAMAVQDVFSMEMSVTPEKVDHAFARKPQAS